MPYKVLCNIVDGIKGITLIEGIKNSIQKIYFYWKYHIVSCLDFFCEGVEKKPSTRSEMLKNKRATKDGVKPAGIQVET